MTQELTLIRTYPESNDSVDYDLPNQILHDLRHTFSHRAVALVDNDGEPVEWYAHHGDYNRVVVWWPDFYDEPVWVAESVYAFAADGYKYSQFRMYDWPDNLDTDAEVVL